MTESRARVWHGVTAAVAIIALGLQVVLIIVNHNGDPGTPLVSRPLRFGRLVSYFTIESNLLVAISCTQLALDPLRDGRWWRVVRLASVVGIWVTGVVHFFLLRPLAHLHGIDYVGDKLLHVAVPLLAVVGWALFGPRPRIDGRAIGLALAWPVLYLAWSLVMGGLSGWYPYPFLDHRKDAGAVGVVAYSIGITVFFLLLFALMRYVDRRAAPVPRATPTPIQPVGTVDA